MTQYLRITHTYLIGRFSLLLIQTMHRFSFQIIANKRMIFSIHVQNAVEIHTLTLDPRTFICNRAIKFRFSRAWQFRTPTH